MHAKLSALRKDRPAFDQEKFLKFARDNKLKYQLSEETGELTVSTWNSEDLVEDFKKLLKNNSPGIF
jgi:hypothetical protein